MSDNQSEQKEAVKKGKFQVGETGRVELTGCSDNFINSTRSDKALLEYSIHQVPNAIKRELTNVFADIKITKDSPIHCILTFQYSRVPLIEFTAEAATEKNRLLESFTAWGGSIHRFISGSAHSNKFHPARRQNISASIKSQTQTQIETQKSSLQHSFDSMSLNNNDMKEHEHSDECQCLNLNKLFPDEYKSNDNHNDNNNNSTCAKIVNEINDEESKNSSKEDNDPSANVTSNNDNKLTVPCSLSYWCDIIDPCSGGPWFGLGGSGIYAEVDGAQLLLRYKTQQAGCCGFLLHPVWGAHNYPGTIFTNAPIQMILQAIDHANTVYHAVHI